LTTRRHAASGFTLIELLAVILIIAVTFTLLVFVFGGSGIREGAQLLHGALVGARDAAAGSGQPRGIRLMLDPAFPVQRLANNQIDPSALLCASHVASIEPAPSYSEGRVSIGNIYVELPGFPPSYLGSSTDVYPCPGNAIFVEECPADPGTGLLNSPTSWFWNIRIGEKIRIGDSGSWYTVVGPMTTVNPELFVNCGKPGVDFPGQKSPLKRFSNGKVVEVEFLFLVNGRDDNGNGYIDEGFDGIDNNADGQVDEVTEWEGETWIGGQGTTATYNAPYTITRRPVRSPGTRDLALPSRVVIDLTTWGSTRERSRLPVNALSGDVDILLTPAGQVVPTTIYSTPASAGMANHYLHFWLADRGDLFDPRASTTPQLPLPQGLNQSPALTGRELKGDVAVVSLNARTGLITTTTPARFDTANIGKPLYNPSLPFHEAEQGGR
jgi:prepilin-type N-terminal cleavage/methylation domain-containing protein